MSVDEALEIFDIFNKDPAVDEVTYEEVKTMMTDLEWKYEYLHGMRG